MAPLGTLLLVIAQFALPFVVRAQARRQGPSPLRTLDLAMLVVLLIQTLFAGALDVVLMSSPHPSADEGVAYLVLLTAAISLWTALFSGWWMGRKLCDPSDLLERAGLFPLSGVLYSGALTPLLWPVTDPWLAVLGLASTALTFVVVLDLLSAR